MNRFFHSPRRPLAGFSLVELMVVVLMVGILMALALVGTNYAMIKSRENKTKMQMAALATAIEQYYADNQAYPEAGRTGDNDEVARQNSADLYAALTGDTDWDGQISDTERRAGRVYLEELLAPSGAGSMQNMVETAGGRRFIIDAFGNSINYFSPRDGEARNTQMRNTTYDLWSYGTDATREDPARWITNW